jgi:hypothetical protein
MGFCQTRAALIRCCGGSTPELDALPDRIGDRVAPDYRQGGGVTFAVTEDGWHRR